VLLVLVAAATAVQMARRSEPAATEALFAEDGKIFLADALSETTPSPLLDSYAGYIHVAPRLIGDVASVLPLEWAPTVMALLTTLAVAVLAVFVYATSSAWIASPAVRAMLAAAFVLLPAAAFEIVASPANLHWYIDFAAFWAVAYPATSRRAVAACAAVALLAALSDPLAAALLPVAIAAALWARGSRIALGALAAGLAVQLVARSGEVDPGADSNVLDLPVLFAERVATSLTIGDRWVPNVGGATSWILLALVVGGCVWASWIADTRGRVVVAASVTLALVTFCVPVQLRGTEPLETGLSGSRYVFLPVMFLLTALAVGLDRYLAGARGGRTVVLVVATWLSTVLLVNYTVAHASRGGPRWRPELDRARVTCEQLPPNVPPEVDVHITPDPKYGLWHARIGCDRIPSD
jgi:hypothetical protein